MRFPSAWGSNPKQKLTAAQQSVNSSVPSAWLTAGTRVEAAGTRLITDMSADVVGQGLCPVTKQPMVKMYANGHPCMVSMDAMVCLPIKD